MDRSCCIVKVKKDQRSQSFYYLSSEIVKANVLVGNSKVLTHFLNGLVHEWWSTEVEFDVLWSLVMIQIIIDDHLMDESYKAITLFITWWPCR